MPDGWLPLLIGTALTGVGLLLHARVRQREAGHHPERQWTATPAEIVESRLEGGEDPYQPHICYRYQAGGGPRIGKRIAPLNGWGHDEDTRAEHVVARWPVGAQVTAYVNPNDPDQAVLVRDPAPGELSQNIVGSVVMIAVGVLLILYGLTR